MNDTLLKQGCRGSADAYKSKQFKKSMCFHSNAFHSQLNFKTTLKVSDNQELNVNN